MAVISVPATSVLPGDVVHRSGCGWREVKEVVPIEHGELRLTALILDHPDHVTSASQRILLAESARCVLFVQAHMDVPIQQ